ncbi:MAG: Dyp-type peroxidase [Candidatus Obscuribacterales bacterium]|nr:Dyp-type peroxidase [Candidatus Obscuribacterales bacterium]
MAISISDLVLPVNLFACLLAGAGAIVVALMVARVRQGKCPFHFASTDTKKLSSGAAKPNGGAPDMSKSMRVSDPANREFLEDLQGNILNGHGRDHAAHVFVRFEPGKAAAARAWIASFAKRHVQSAYEQFNGSKQFKTFGIDAGIFGHIALSASGYSALGFQTAQQPHGLNPRNHEDGKGYEEVFRKGLKSRRNVLHDPELSQWERAFLGDIHMMVLLAADNDAQLDTVLATTLESLSNAAEHVHVERGLGLTRQLAPQDPSTVAHVEHFGFVDGRSQPLMVEEQIEQERQKGGTDKWDPSAPLNLVLAPDPLGKPGKSFGSFLVFRKLEQNVRAFHKSVHDLAKTLDVPVELARAMVMGRFQDGTPVTLRDKSGTSDVPNNFNYDDDSAGLKCPFQSHVRKTNPRLSVTGSSELRHRIARRGIPYGGTLIESDKLEDLPETGRGLLFFCYQADIFEQFEFIQRTWANFSNFPKPATGLDPVVGQQDPNAPCNAAQKWPAGWNKQTTCPGVDIAGFVRLKGGEYFFSPSLSFLKGLA